MPRRLALESLEQRHLLSASNVGVARFVGDDQLVFLLDLDEDVDAEIEYRFDLTSFARPGIRTSSFVTPIVGRWQGDGVYRPGIVVADLGLSPLQWYLGNPASVSPIGFGREFSQRPVVGDWNGDGFDDIGVFSPFPEVTWQLRLRDRNSTTFVHAFGDSAGNLPIVGDWDGNMTSNVGYVDNPEDAWVQSFAEVVGADDLGTIVSRIPKTSAFPIDQPITGDWNGDGKADVGYVDRAGNELQWNFVTDDDGTVGKSILFGIAGDIPVTGVWQNSPKQTVRFNDRIVVAGSVVDLGSTATNQATYSSEFEITNDSESQLIIRNLSATGSYRIISQDTHFIDPGRSATISVEIDTRRSGPKLGTVSWVHNATNSVSDFAFDMEFRVGEVLYVAFDGYQISSDQLSMWSRDWSRAPSMLDADNNGIRIDAFRSRDPVREETIDTIMELVRADFAPFNVLVERLRPSDQIVADRGRTTVFVGRSTVSINSHVAGDIDTNNHNDIDLAFVGEEQRQSTERLAFATANAISHEAGHTFGLLHVLPSVDGQGNREVMNGETRTPGQLADEGFLDVDALIEGSGTTQNSFKYLQSIFGAAPILPVHHSPNRLDGDCNLDGIVDFVDLIILAEEFGRRSDLGKDLRGDFNGDGIVDHEDLKLMVPVFFERTVILPTF